MLYKKTYKIEIEDYIILYLNAIIKGKKYFYKLNK